MQYIIGYYSLGEGGGLSMFWPEFTHREIVDAPNEEELNKYISTKKDKWGNIFKKKKSFGFDFISKAGAVKIKAVKVKKI